MNTSVTPPSPADRPLRDDPGSREAGVDPATRSTAHPAHGSPDTLPRADERRPTWRDDEGVWHEHGMHYLTRTWVRPEDLNANGTLFGGSLLRWIDEEAAIYAILQLGNHHLATKFISEINFEASAEQGDLLELGLVATHFGRTSVTVRALVRNMITQRTILSIEKIVFVNMGPDGKPAPHGYHELTDTRDRLPHTQQGETRLPAPEAKRRQFSTRRDSTQPAEPPHQE